MLNVEGLKNQLKQTIQEIIIPAIKEIELARQSVKSEAGNKLAQQIADTFDDLVTEPLAENLANTIDYYVKNISITGTIITTGSPITQTAVITSMKTPVVNGKIPNTLGIS